MKIKFVRVALAISVLGSAPFAHAAPAGQPGMFRRLVQKVKAHFGGKSAPIAPERIEALSPDVSHPGELREAAAAERARAAAPVVTPASPATPVQAPERMIVEVPKPVVAPAPSVIAPAVAVRAPEPARVSVTPPANPFREAMVESVLKPVFTPRPSTSSYRWEEPVKAKVGYQQLDATARAPIDELLRQVERPTVAQLMKTVRAAYGGKLPTENPFGSAAHVKHESALIADMVAQLEHSFPGGQWLPLGRDAVLIADALDGFYRAIGQTDRVRRLDMSGLSLPHYRDANRLTYEEDRPMIYGFLKANGLDLAKVKERPPYVMIDVTSYGETSQSTQLMRSTYRTWVKDFGGNPKDLYDHVNFIGTPMGGSTKFISSYRSSRAIDGIKDELRNGTTTDGPRELLYLGGNMHKLTYTAAWHADFLKMYAKKDGSITADPGRASSTSSKEAVLAELFEVHALTTSPAFLAEVQKTAMEKYGYAFPMQRTQQLARPGASAAAAAPAAAPATKAARLAEFTKLAEVPEVAAPATSTYMESLKLRLPAAANKGEVAVEFVRDLAGMRARNSVDRSMAKAALREIARHVDLRSPAMKAELASTFELFPEFRAEFKRALKNKH